LELLEEYNVYCRLLTDIKDLERLIDKEKNFEQRMDYRAIKQKRKEKLLQNGFRIFSKIRSAYI